ncbi:phage tail sheath family protein [Burkholderia sp. MSHR3999]|uniref:phage tail sheath subtilisin-like domain-containing protein n=1 Tax=Burkholderia sp. MSHR3999 TaxID=1542965 RepID=UPI0005AD0452|nr:phage tail sheath subtilisin-like domain-containing protein [Burkholderia sp. MSHR3999]KIP19550.1 phage tail sheath family protein [Burkholderia sp. MSHR3999]
MTSPNVTFNSIPSSIRKPGKYFEFNTTGAVNALPGNLQRVLIIGQRLASGTTAALVVTGITSDEQAAVRFGRGSIAHLMAKAALKANNYLQLDVIAVDDAAAGIAATGAVLISGPATTTGNMTIRIGNDSAVIAVANGATAETIAANLVAQIGQQPDLPVTAAVDANNAANIVLTAKHKGLAGNGIALSALTETSGVTGTITAMSGGLSDPDIQPALTSVFAAAHDIIAAPFATQASLTTLRTHLDAVSGPLEQRGTIAAAGWPGTLATATTLAGQLNAGRISLAWYNGSVSPAYQIAAAYAAVIASEEDPARPLNTLALTGLDVTDVTLRAGRQDQEAALHNGVTPFEVGPGDVVQIVRAITTYTVDAQDIEDPALLDLTTIRILDYMRKAWRQRIALRFPRDKLSDKTPPKVRSELLDVAYKAEELEIIENVDKWKANLIVERDSQSAGQCNAKIPCDVVSGLHVFAGVIDLII